MPRVRVRLSYGQVTVSRSTWVHPVPAVTASPPSLMVTVLPDRVTERSFAFPATALTWMRTESTRTPVAACAWPADSTVATPGAAVVTPACTALSIEVFNAPPVPPDEHGLVSP